MYVRCDNDSFHVIERDEIERDISEVKYYNYSTPQ